MTTTTLPMRALPQIQLKIIGSYPPPRTIHALASKHVEVLGYVPETVPYLESTHVSVAPLRHGGGMKGKVGEAMSYRLPVVKTSLGAEGFRLEPSKNLLIGDTPELFSAQVIALLDDSALYNHIFKSGYDFFEKHFSTQAVERMLDSSLARLARLPRRRISPTHQLMNQFQNFFARHIA